MTDYSVKEALAKSGIAAGGVTYSFFGLPFSEWAAILTCIFMLISIVLTFPKLYQMFRALKRDKNECKNSDSP